MALAKRILILTAIFSCLNGLLTGCNGSGGSAHNLADSDPEPTPAANENLCQEPVTKVLDYGRKATAGTTAGLRGAFSDVTLNPVSSTPSVVFTDTGSLTLNYGYWDGSEFKYEVVAGGVTTNFPRLVFLSSGKPLIFWANGATAVYMAARNSASTTTASAWTVTAIETVATMTTRAVEVSVNELDQVGVLYISAVGTLARFIGCSSDCDSASNYVGMGAIANSISATASATNHSADIQWCNNGSDVFKPYVVFGGTANSQIARCASATLADCALPANWQTAVITDGTVATGANQVTTKLSIANTVDAPFHVVAKTSASGIRAYAQNTGGCATGALTFSATSRQIVAGANVGNAWGKLHRDSQGRFHFVANEAQTNIRYFNQLTGDPLAAWSTVGNVETVGAAGLPAAGATRGSFVVDEGHDQLLMTYGRTAAVTPALTWANMVLAYNTCPSGGTGCLTSTLASPSNASGMVFGNAPLNSTGQIGLTTAQFPKSATIESTSDGIPAAAYVDFSVGSATTGVLKYAIRNGSSAASSWNNVTVPGPVSPQSVSLKFDHDDKPWIAYYDASSLRYFLATNTLTDGTGTWKTHQFPIGAVAAPILPGVNAVALAMSYTLGNAKPVMIVSNAGSVAKTVSTAVFNPGAENWTSVTTLDSGTAVTSKLSTDFDRAGNLVLAYYDTTNNAIRYSGSSSGGITWSSPASVITASGGMGLEIKLNPTNSRPAIAFYDRSVNLLRYRECTSDLATCHLSVNWGTLGSGVIDSTLGVSGLTAAATDGLLSLGLNFSSAGKIWLTFSRGSLSSNGSLMYSYTSQTFGGLFVTAAELHAGANAVISSPVAATPANYAVGGWSVGSSLSSTGALHSLFIGPGNYLYYSSCGE
ncbi:hypothetical protein [Bdellovibrio sp. HCB2-146]|uniref:hypothetical protein n=1 Tax=Bdellovibrio sp. HCB2-146 TaxID=3394362 RepID=UPI0039BCE3E1